ncbi:5'-flap endonuclease [Ascochyta rabiei]|nr:5'-flap endonuclease [Ascochyta rabiei]UPX12011.1 5'-flap endonuclease [Ascochyta rabiei]
MAGKEYTIVVLSSSPPAPDVYNSPHYAAPNRRVAMPPSSPFALSPPSSPRKHVPGALTSGSRAVPIPGEATRGFATVSSLVRSEHFANRLDDEPAELQQIESHGSLLEGIEESARKPRTRGTKDATAPNREKPKPKPKPRGRKTRVEKELYSDTVPNDPELRLPRTTKPPCFDSADAQATLEASAGPAVHAPKLTKAGKPRKPRAKKEKVDTGGTEAKPKRTRVTKPKAAVKTDTAQRKAADAINNSEAPGAAVDAEFQDVSIWNVPQSPRSRLEALQGPPNPLAERLDLEEAVTRRRDWTPPRDTAAQSPSTVSTGKENRPSGHNASTGTFTHLIHNFTYESPTAKVTGNAAMPAAANPGVTKRRRVELIDLPGVQTTSRASSPEKGMAPKKKPRTITDLVTGQYAPKETDRDAQAVTSDFFSPQTSTTKMPLNDVATLSLEAPLKKPPRKRSKSRNGSEAAKTNSKPRIRKTSTKPPAKSKPVTEKLLSPTSAVLRLSRQEVLFGTSSQLALEESPTTVRQIQKALTESEHDMGAVPPFLLDNTPRWPRLHKIQGKRGLWRESTRDNEGGLLENIENVYIPEPDRTENLPLLVDVARVEPSLPPDFVDIDEIEHGTIAISSDPPTPLRAKLLTQVVDQTLRTSEVPDSDVFDDIDDFGLALPPSNQKAQSQDSFADIDSFQAPAETESHQPPSSKVRRPASAPTMAAHSPKKRRGRPLKTNSVIPSVTASAPLPSHNPSLPQKTSQRHPSTPKGSGRFVDIEEILDSEEEALEAFSPTPPRVRRLQNSPSLPLTLDLERSVSSKPGVEKSEATPIFRILISQLEWINIKSSICASITAHVRSIPPTTDPKKPSWHEKILMYDPIVLEDLTAYLNSQTKLRIYKRATQKQIKAYNNELKMKGNAILGVERDDQVLAIEKELETHMIRDWCQEMSICCIHAKESRGRGSARKGYY